MNTEQETQALEAEIDALLATLTKESDAAASEIQTQLAALSAGADALETQLDASRHDIAEFMVEQSEELDTLIDEEQKEIEAEKPEDEEQ